MIGRRAGRTPCHTYVVLATSRMMVLLPDLALPRPLHDRILGIGVACAAYRNSSIQSKFSVANRWAMKSLIACQNEASRGLSSASRLTASSSSSSAARCAARFVPTGVRKSRILSSAVGSLFASNSDDRPRDRNASMHASMRVLMARLNAHTPLGVHYTALVQTARWKRGIIPPLHEWPPVGGSHGKLHRKTKILSHASRRRGRVAAHGIAYCCGAGCRHPGAGAFLVSASLLRQDRLL